VANPDLVLLHSTGIFRHHWLAQFAAKRIPKLWHILHDPVHQNFLGRVRVRLYQEPELLGPCALAPILTLAREELTNRSKLESPI
jgi:hypothetical protein